MTSGRITTVVARTRSQPRAATTLLRTAPHAHGELRASTELTAIDRATVIFRDTTLGAIAHASTTAGYVIGHRNEAATAERLSQHFGVPAVTSGAAAVAALRTHGVERLQVVHPPWFRKEFDELAGAYFRVQGFHAEVTNAMGLASDPARVEAPQVVDWVEQNITDWADAVFLAGTGFRAAEAVQELELRTSRLIIEANQALLWGVLAAKGTRWDVTGYGQLLRATASTT